ncbi:hypothetical protein VA7868_03666 [Vibrio aerogenes CECT 7868]|uniref:Uncharacterized protein n=1 Tax=Vibrio aerogenes CECT 7868 TaxID=1216006 RepID=A0A1M6AZ08_9VIBR|nr:hypothetical protein [Vibrio aerogenes]SHI41548.1 hypothetical protein VA7868_03666 [Vibrio aerogenes CECT 7868]
MNTFTKTLLIIMGVSLSAGVLAHYNGQGNNGQGQQQGKGHYGWMSQQNMQGQNMQQRMNQMQRNSQGQQQAAGHAQGRGQWMHMNHARRHANGNPDCPYFRNQTNQKNQPGLQNNSGKNQQGQPMKNGALRRGNGNQSGQNSPVIPNNSKQ